MEHCVVRTQYCFKFFFSFLYPSIWFFIIALFPAVFDQSTWWKKKHTHKIFSRFILYYIFVAVSLYRRLLKKKPHRIEIHYKIRLHDFPFVCVRARARDLLKMLFDNDWVSMSLSIYWQCNGKFRAKKKQLTISCSCMIWHIACYTPRSFRK